MNIKVNAAKLNTGSNVTLTHDEAVEYAKHKLEESLSVFDIDVDADIKLYTEGSETDPVQKCDIKVVGKNGLVLNQSAHSRSTKKAIDRAMPELKRQMKKYKTKQIDKRRDRSRKVKTSKEKVSPDENE